MPKHGKGKRNQKDLDWAEDENFDENRSILYVEHTDECPIFKDKALELGSYLQAQFPEKIIQLVRNRNGRPGAFEISFSKTARTSVHDLWSGIDKGPPRREKFPADFGVLVPEVKRVLKKVYMAPAVRLDGERQN